MSDYTGPGLFEIIPKYASGMSLNVWGGGTTAGTSVKLYPRSRTSPNTHFQIAAAGGTQANPEKGDREYLIIAGNSGLYLSSNGNGKVVTTEIRHPLDSSIRWKLAHAGNGAFYINSVDGSTQLNVRGSGKETGTEVITYGITEAENAQFLLKAVENV